MTVTLSAPPLSRVRTFLFGGLALVWFGEMLFTDVQPVLIPFVPLLIGWVMYAAVGPTRGDL